MKKPAPDKSSYVVVLAKDLRILFEFLSNKGYKIIGPAVYNDVILYDYLLSAQDLPVGFTDKQDAAQYKLHARKERLFFNFRAGANNWKWFLYPSRQKLWEAQRIKRGFKVVGDKGEIPKLAFMGVLPCDLSAITILDKVFTEGPYTDLSYRKVRDNNIIIAANCTGAGNNCFCVSMKTGPRARSGFDLAFTEITIDDNHIFLFESGSEAGSKILEGIPHRKADKSEIDYAESAIEDAASQMGKELDTRDIQVLLDDCLDHPKWQDIASRCLTCGNCTMVCPTCFCSTVEDTTDLAGETAGRWRCWDSCFTKDFSYIAGGSIRHSAKARYRQWFTHKLASWYDQFGTSGCVGCGRCITWCPAGIDITEEARAFRKSEIAVQSSISKED
jgi:ferredoxin